MGWHGLRTYSRLSELEAWIAAQRWQAAPGGWIVTGELQGWQFRIDVILAGLCVSASAPGGGDPAVWVVGERDSQFG
jgi:hypothetical protein